MGLRRNLFRHKAPSQAERPPRPGRGVDRDALSAAAAPDPRGQRERRQALGALRDRDPLRFPGWTHLSHRRARRRGRRPAVLNSGRPEPASTGHRNHGHRLGRRHARVPASPGIGVGDLVAQDVGLVVLAAAGVGIFMRRDLRQAAARLSLVRPAWWQVVLALAVAGAMYAFSVATVALNQVLTPDLYRQVSSNTSQIFGGLVSNPVGIAALAVLPAIGEEILFRGALQPRLGLIATALLFTASHSEYGFSLDIVAVLVAAFGLGLLRKFTNTTTSAISHATYNLAVGVGVAASQVDAAVAIELGLIAITAYAIWSRWRRHPHAGEPLTGRVVEPDKID